MSPAKDEELEQRYRDLFENEAVQSVVDARTPNEAKPVDESAILEFVQATDKEHVGYLRSVFRRFGNTDPTT